jgi:threonine dehydrogenase-like Zn-dependent dehydrogenase
MRFRQSRRCDRLNLESHHRRTRNRQFGAVDIVVECAGVPQLVVDMISRLDGEGIACLTGLSNAGTLQPFDGGDFNRRLVLQNEVVFGTVNANRRHYEAAMVALASADPAWLAGLITRRVPLARWQEAFEKRRGDIKVVLEFEDVAA